jgi:ferrous-iron efflux pump FieF
MDVGASLLSFVAARYALMPADDDHRFGHGKVEDIAALAQATFIAGSGVFVLIEAGRRFLNPAAISHEWLGIVVMLLSSVLIAVLLAFQRYVVSKTGSMIVKADAAHYKTDLLINALVIISLLLVSSFGFQSIDMLLALLIAFYILLGAWEIGKEAFDKLMDKELPDEHRQLILETILKHESVEGVHDLRTRLSGSSEFIQFHLELDGKLSLQKAHDIAEAVEEALHAHFPVAEVLIHTDPYTDNEVSLQVGRVVAKKKV